MPTTLDADCGARRAGFASISRTTCYRQAGALGACRTVVAFGVDKDEVMIAYAD